MFDFSSVLFSIIVPLIFFTCIGFILYKLVEGISEWHTNNQSPRENSSVKVVTKRQEVSHHINMNNMNNNMNQSTTSSRYFVTFEFSNGQRREFSVKNKVYGQIADGDKGQLTYQGTRFIDFYRQF